ncbi:hypothetical protein Pmar_PMAR028067, partial [Perkinsus marinus ATCC 50983]
GNGHISDDEIEEFLDDSARNGGRGQQEASSIVVPVSDEWSVVREQGSGVSYWHNNTTGELVGIRDPSTEWRKKGIIPSNSAARDN